MNSGKKRDVRQQRYVAPLSNPDNAPAKQEAFCAELETMTDADLQARAEQMIWLSAFAGNNPRSCYHWQADACYDEADRRGKPEIYELAYKNVARAEGIDA
jgi:hypothetical protein